MARFCGNCGALLREAVAFCGQCGIKIQVPRARARRLSSATQLGVLLIALFAVVGGAYWTVTDRDEAPLSSTQATIVSSPPAPTQYRETGARTDSSSQVSSYSSDAKKNLGQGLKSETFGQVNVKTDVASGMMVSFSPDNSVNDGQCNDEVASIVKVVSFTSIGDGGAFDLVISDPKWGEETFSEVDIAAMPPDYRAKAHALLAPGARIRIRSQGCGSGLIAYLTEVARN